MRTFSPRSAARDTKRPRFLATIGTVGLATAFAFVVGPGTASALPANCVQPVVDGPVTCTFTFTGGEQSLPIPAGVTSVYVVATGGSGGDKRFDGTGVGGLGATATGNVVVAPQSTLYVLVGGTGDIISPPSPSFNGGGTSYSPGGGASDVRTVSGTDVAALNSRLLVAGGGGGAARDVNGGNAGAPGITDPGIQGGGGGGAGTAVSGGGGGASSAFDGGGSPGGLGVGGAGTTEGGFLYGGGGGGGLYGGGGGGAGGDGGGGSGGGGSSLIPAGGTIGVAGVGIAPQIVITYQVGATPPAPNCFGSVCLPAM